MATAASEAKVTSAHEEIQSWVEERGGHPAKVKGTEILRIDYPGFSGEERLEEISWDEFFREFDKKNLAFLHQDKTKDGKPSRFSKLIDRENADNTD